MQANFAEGIRRPRRDDAHPPPGPEPYREIVELVDELSRIRGRFKDWIADPALGVVVGAGVRCVRNGQMCGCFETEAVTSSRSRGTARRGNDTPVK
jgi:hypothetical protein